jgi:hypothetical protein
MVEVVAKKGVSVESTGPGNCLCGAYGITISPRILKRNWSVVVVAVRAQNRWHTA